MPEEPVKLTDTMLAQFQKQSESRERLLRHTTVDARTGKRVPKPEFALEEGLTNEEVMGRSDARDFYLAGLQNAAGMVGSAAVGAGVALRTFGLADVAVARIGKMVAEADTRKKLSQRGVAVEEFEKEGDRAWKLTVGEAVAFVKPEDIVPRSVKNVGELYTLLSGKLAERAPFLSPVWMAVGTEKLKGSKLVKSTPEMNFAYDLGQFIGLMRPSKALAEKAVAGLPAVAGKTGVKLMKPLGGGITFGAADLMQKLDKKLATGEEIDWAGVGFSTLTGVGFGTVDEIANVLYGRYALQKALSIDGVPLKMLSKKDQAILSAARQSWISLSMNQPFSLSKKAWMDVYGDDVGRIFAQTFMNGEITGAYQGVEKSFKKLLLGPSAAIEVAEGESYLEGLARPRVKYPKTGEPFSVTAFRGTSERTPVDTGWYGAGRYFTTSSTYARQYGGIGGYNITLANPYVVSGRKALAAFDAEFAAPVREKYGTKIDFVSMDKEVSGDIRRELMARGHDGVVIRPHSNFTGFDEIVVFHPEKSVNQNDLMSEYIQATSSSGKSGEAHLNDLRNIGKSLINFQDIPFIEPGKAPLITPIVKPKEITGRKAPREKAHTNIHPYDEPYQFDPMGAEKLITNKWYVMQKEGLGRLVNPLEAGSLKATLEGRNLDSLVIQLLKETNKSAPFGEKVGRALFNKTTTPIERLFYAMDAYDVPPESWPKYDKESFLKLRSLTKYCLQIQNEAREKAGRPLIKDVGSYVSRFKEQVVDDVFIGHNPTESPYVYHMMRNVPTDLFNPMAKRRKIEEMVDGFFQTDLNKVLPMMVRYAVRDAYVTDPYRAAMEQANELKNAGIMPPQVYEDFLSFVNHDVLGRKHWLDAGLDKTLDKLYVGPSVKAIANVFGRDVSSITQSASKAMRWLLIHGAMDLKVRIPLRNMTQQLLDLDYYPLADVGMAKSWSAVGYWPKTPKGESLKDAIESTDWFRLMKEQFTELDNSGWAKLKGVPLAGQKLTQTWNYEQTARVKYIDWRRKFEASKDPSSPYYISVRAKAVNDTLRDAYLQREQYALHKTSKLLKQIGQTADEAKRAKLIAQREAALKLIKDKFLIQEYFEKNFPKKLNSLLVKEEDMLPMIRDAMRLSQFEYFSTSMPWVFRSDAARAGLSLQSWWMSFYGSHMREGLHRVMTGRESSGRVLWPGQRYQFLKGWGMMYALGRTVESLFGVQMIANILPRPGTRQSPIAETLTGAVDMVYGKVSNDDAVYQEGLKKFTHGATIMIPLYGGVKEMREWWTGKQTSRRFFAYPTEAQRKKEKEKSKWKEEW